MAIADLYKLADFKFDDPTYKPQYNDDEAKDPYKLSNEQRRESTRDAGILFNIDKYTRMGKTRAEAMELVSRNLLQSGNFKLDEARNRVSKLVKGDLSLNPPKQALGSPQQATLASFAQSFLTPTPEAQEATISAQAKAFMASRMTQSQSRPRSAGATFSPMENQPRWMSPPANLIGPAPAHSLTPGGGGRTYDQYSPTTGAHKPVSFSPVFVRGL